MGLQKVPDSVKMPAQIDIDLRKQKWGYGSRSSAYRAERNIIYNNAPSYSTKEHHDHLNKIVFNDNRLLILPAYLKQLFTSKSEVRKTIADVVHISSEEAKKAHKINGWQFANVRLKIWNMNFKLILLLLQFHRYSVTGFNFMSKLFLFVNITHVL